MFVQNDRSLLSCVKTQEGRADLKFLQLILIPLVFLFTQQCTSTIQSRSAIDQFHISVTHAENQNGDQVRITGQNKDSALFIQGYEVSYNEDTVRVKIFKALRNTGYAGPYGIQFYIPKNIQIIILGDNDVIWKR